MNLPTMTMPKTEARKRYLEYKREIEARHDDELAQIAAGYRQMALGRQVLSLRETIEAGGTVDVTDQRYESGYGNRNYTVQLPALACIRADQTECWVTRGRGRTVSYTPKNPRGWPYQPAPKRSVRVRGARLGGRLPWSPFVATVPLVPPALRPRTHLRNFHVLWEAKWTRGKPLAPEDPALLKRVTGDLFVVLAVWDLTPIERAVLGARG